MVCGQNHQFSVEGEAWPLATPDGFCQDDLRPVNPDIRDGLE
jgi:hypothetical protein